MSLGRSKRTILLGAGILLILALVVAAVVLWQVGVFGRPPAAPTPAANVEVQGPRARYQAGDSALVVEFLDDDLVHFAVIAQGPGPALDQPLAASPMVAKSDYPGPSRLTTDGGLLETPALRVQVAPNTLCITVTDVAREPDLRLTTLCPEALDADFKRLRIDPAGFQNVYGLGEQFPEEATPDGDWAGRLRTGGDYGNMQASSALGGSVGNDQFPIAYFLGEGKDGYALFLDSGYKQLWALDKEPWRVATQGDEIRFYVLAGPDLPDLRQDYLELTGRPPVPPRKAFGLWVSEYGYDNWAELEDKLRTLRDNRFPVDGFVLDLQWYGGITQTDDTRMGSLSWDEANFPDPAEEIARLRDEEGVGLVAIEQPYIGKNLPEHAALADKGYLVRDGCETCAPAYLTANPWWGRGGMIDWTNATARDFWHDWKREPLIQAGLAGHWTDLGEPELYDAKGWYAGLPEDGTMLHDEAAVHNLYNLLWAQGIYDGYARNQETQRPFILSRSGTSGIQRYGAAMWSGDIGGSLPSLTAHLNVQMHMALSGVDYYGADIGGFWRPGGDMDETYTAWFAHGMAFDVPGRAHTFNLCNCNETAPDRIGDMESNRANVRQRYEFIPYVYSLAHRAYLYGEPVVPPLVYFYQDDPNVREMGGEKLLGRDVLVATASTAGQYERTVYLPAGTWVDYHTGQWYESTGQEFGPFSLYPDGLFQLPTFVRAGALLPQMYVDDQTMNAFGRRLDGTTRDELIVRAYAAASADAQPGTFTLYEDDGTTIAYQQGAVRTTLLSQQLSGSEAVVTIAAAGGTYTGAPAARNNVVRLYLDGSVAAAVTLNGTALPLLDGAAAFDAAASGWYNAGVGLVLAKSGVMDVAQAKEFRFALAAPAQPTPGAVVQPLPTYWPAAGWRSAVPEQVGMDSATLGRAIDFLARKDILLHRWLLVRQGYVVVDAAFAREFPAEAMGREAATGPLLSTLIGIAVDQGAIPGVQEPVLNFFPGRTIANRDARKEAMTVEDLLTMRSGLNCQPQETMVEMLSSPDWVQFILDLPMAAEPGTAFVPCEVNAHLLSAILQQSIGLTTLDYARERLLGPLGIADVEWAADPQGVNQGWAGLQMDAADMARLGLLYLRGGQWDGQQLVSADWIAAATQTQATFDGGAIGYLWYTEPPAYYSYAPLSSWLVVLPQLDTVTVLGNGLGGQDGTTVRILASSFVGPAARSTGPLPEDPAGLAQLQASLAAAGRPLAPQPVPPLPEITGTISGQRYSFEDTDLGWETMSVAFPGGAEASLTIEGSVQVITVPVGLDGIRRVLALPIMGRLILIGSKGSWSDADTFVLDLVQRDATQQAGMQFEFTFQDDFLDVVIRSSEGETVTVRGQKQ